jgi:hypothetical protein
LNTGPLGEIVVLEFQVLGWVLIVLFFAAMVGGHRSVTNRHME